MCVYMFVSVCVCVCVCVCVVYIGLVCSDCYFSGVEVPVLFSFSLVLVIPFSSKGT